MNNGLISILSRHQVILTLAIFVIFALSGAFFYSQHFDNQIAAIEEAKCLSQDEINVQKVKLEMLQKQAASAQMEVLKAEKDIVSGSASDTTVKRRIEELKTEIQSDYAVSLENENVNRLCPEDEGVEPPECVSAKRSYSNLLKDNEAKKEELKSLEAKGFDATVDNASNVLDEKKAVFDDINNQIADLIQAITIAEANICPTDETR